MDNTDIFYLSRELFPESQEKEIFNSLVNSWGKMKEPIVIQFTNIQDIKEYPFVIGIGIAGFNWEGFFDEKWGI